MISESMQSTERMAEARRSFVREVASRVVLPPQLTVEMATTAVMCVLTERLTRGGAYGLVHALPESVGALFARCLEHRIGPPSTFDRSEMLAGIAEHLGVTPLHAELICRAVLSTVREQLPPDMAEHVSAQLPKDIKALWHSIFSAQPTTSSAAAPQELPETLRAHVLAAVEREAGGLPDGIGASAAFTAVMCAFSQRLSAGEARHLVLALPATLRPLVSACLVHREERGHPFDRAELLRRVADHLETTPAAAETIVHAVFAAVKRCLPERDIEDAASQLPWDLKAFWLSA